MNPYEDINPYAGWHGVHIETFGDHNLYSPDQIRLACAVAAMRQPGKLILCVPPEHEKRGD